MSPMPQPSSIPCPFSYPLFEQVTKNPLYKAADVANSFDYTFRTADSPAECLLAQAAYSAMTIDAAMKLEPGRFTGASENRDRVELHEQMLVAFQSLSATERGLVYELECVRNEKTRIQDWVKKRRIQFIDDLKHCDTMHKAVLDTLEKALEDSSKDTTPFVSAPASPQTEDKPAQQGSEKNPITVPSRSASPLPIRAQHSLPRRRGTPYPARGPTRREVRMAMGDIHISPSQRSTPSRSSYQDRVRAGITRPGTCFKCNRPGHWATDHYSYRCTGCGKSAPGHAATHCPDKPADDEELELEYVDEEGPDLEYNNEFDFGEEAWDNINGEPSHVTY